ncbi:hypothetical protein GJ744_003942 [Endocarpon pusillum]|uniref:Uncharacterized protein n=1 Tax=Endocarpon pusillum TaxID=364733 RepID=A0A8H7A777_9EURO|nr:hypothetical protein GJ744_003942 [Endocarpon pusillum]
MQPDKDQTKAVMEELEVSNTLSSEESPELLSTRTSSIWTGADAHRGEPLLASSSDDMTRFTATGRPFKPENHYQSTWAGLADAPQAVPGKTLPWKFRDESLISVPCLRPKSQEEGIVPGEANKKNNKRWWRRRPLMSNGRMNDLDKFVMRRIQRGEYLKHYAKDEQGAYIGTEGPAEDCILRGDDLETYRSGRDKDVSE